MNGCPAFAVREEIVSVAAISMVVPALKRLVVGRAGGAGGGFAARRVRFTGVCIGWRSGTSRICVVDSAGASVRLRAVESVGWPPDCSLF